MTPATATPTGDEARIRACIDAVAQAIRVKDVNALMTHYTPDTIVFDLMPLQTLGRDAYRRNFEAWFGSVEGPIEFEIHDLRIATRDDVAFGHYTSAIRCRRKTGSQTEYQVRVSLGLRRVAGDWLIVHEHVSLPFASMEAMQAALGSA
jgi:uncharacterized protein (TIGR02246 family)